MAAGLAGMQACTVGIRAIKPFALATADITCGHCGEATKQHPAQHCLRPGASAKARCTSCWLLPEFSRFRDSRLVASLTVSRPGQASLVASDRLYGAKKQVLDSLGMGSPQEFPITTNGMPLQLLSYLRLARLQDAAEFAKARACSCVVAPSLLWDDGSCC